MPIHDWTRVGPNLFHAFHQSWIVALCNSLNDGPLPEGYYALPEQVIGGPVPDVLALERFPRRSPPAGTNGGLAVKTTPPRTRFVREAEEDQYARKADRISVRHEHGRVVAVVEVVSPGNKASRHGIHAFVTKMGELLHEGIHLLVIDLFPPGPRDPHGLHKLIWDEVKEEPFEMPPDKPLLLAAHQAKPGKVAYVEPVAVGDVLPEMALYLEPGGYVLAPLEASYQTTWAVFPAPLKGLLDTPPPDRPGSP